MGNSMSMAIKRNYAKDGKSWSETHYDDNDKLVKFVTSTGECATYDYDDNGRLIRINAGRDVFTIQRNDKNVITGVRSNFGDIDFQEFLSPIILKVITDVIDTEF